MKERPLCIISIIYMIGILIGLYFHISIALFLLVLVLGIMLIFMLRYKRIIKSKRKIAIILIIIFPMLLGILYIKEIDNKYEKVYQSFSNSKEIKVEAVIISDIQEKQYSYICEIEVININEEKTYKGMRLFLNIKKESNEIPKITYGDLIQFTGIFKIPDVTRNYGGFNEQEYLKTQKIYGTIYSDTKVQVVKKNKMNRLGQIMYTIQNNIKNKIKQLLPEENENVCIGILLGDKEDLSEKIEENFKNSNLTHMLAVSGAHISYILLGLNILLNRLGRKFYKQMTIIFLFFFMALTNFTPSVMRASIMNILILIAGLIHRKSDLYCNLALSSIIILIINPYTILNMGFQLSYGGTIGIILLNQKINNIVQKKREIKNKIIKYIANTMIVTISANIVILPIMAYQFHTISLTFWISNILASPLMGIIIALGFLTYLLSLIYIPLAEIVAIPLNIILELLLKIAEYCSNIPGSSILVKTPEMMTIIFYYIIILLLFYPKKNELISAYQNIKQRIRKRKKSEIICIVLTIILILSFTIFQKHRNLKIYFIDVGQGDSTLMITPTNKTILIDGGGNENFDVGERILIPYLLDRKITTIDYVMISHFDTDHIGGILSILEKLKVKNIIIATQGETSENYQQLKEIIKKKKINIIAVQQGDKITIDTDVYINILFPEEYLIQENRLNNNSIVAKLCYSHFSILFTGDIEKIPEERLVQEYHNSQILQSTILKVAHHGSKTSSTQSILECISPKIALIGVRGRKYIWTPA